MDLSVDDKSPIPVHLQLKEQLKQLILTGSLAPGERLPSVRELAGFLRINRNTAARAVAVLEREGFVRTRPGRGVFVAEELPAGASPAELEDLLDQALQRAAALGMGPEELSLALLARARTGAAPSRRYRLLFLECNRPQAELFARQIAGRLPADVDPLLVEELDPLVRRGPEALAPYDAAVTTFFHVQEVEAALRPLGVPVYALLATASLETLTRLRALPRGTRVGCLCLRWEGARNLRRSIESAGLDLELVTACAEDEESVARMLARAQVVVCSSLAVDCLRAAGGGREVTLIVDDRTLDEAGIRLLGRDLARRAAGGVGAARGGRVPGRPEEPAAGAAGAAQGKRRRV